MGVVASISIFAVSLLVLIAKDGFILAVDFDVFIETVLFLFAVAFLEVFALELLVAGVVRVGVELLSVALPAYGYFLWW